MPGKNALPCAEARAVCAAEYVGPAGMKAGPPHPWTAPPSGDQKKAGK